MNDPTMPDHAAPPLKTDGISPKTLASGAAGLVVGVVVAVLNLVADGTLIGGPVWLQTVILAAVPPVLAYLSAFQAPPGNVVQRTGE